MTYQAPVTGPKASVTVHWDNAFMNTPVHVHGPACSLETGKKAGNLNNKAIGMPATGDALTFDVVAGQPVGISLHALRRTGIPYQDGDKKMVRLYTRSCHDIVDLDPVDGARYDMHFILEPDKIQGCTVQVKRVTADGTMVPEPSAKLRENCRLPDPKY
jgi:hypothetical protein